MNHDLTIWGAVKTGLLYVLAWFGSWKAAEVNAVLGSFAFLVTIGFGATQWYVLWRDKIRKPRRPLDATRPMPLD